MPLTLPGGGLLTSGLTTGQAPFIEEARSRGELYIEQPWELYSDDNHESWKRLYGRIRPRWERYANEHFLRGLDALELPRDRVPRLAEVNRTLRPLTGFEARAVSGYVPAFLFFDCLRRREFPTTITIRPHDKLDYLPEPDIFHDIAGHVPMHTDRAFAEALVRFGDCAHTAVDMTAAVKDEAEQCRRLTSIIKALSRFFWFAVEFGLMRGRNGVCAYGSGLLSSYGELEHAVASDRPQRYPMQIEWAINQAFEIDRYQPLLFIVDSFDHLFDLVDRLEKWMRAGKLNDVAPGEPGVSETDLRSFLRADPSS
ncbi:MAG: phenylalanine 4-monooxygenase [Bryobacteraceae bacterium]|nr:phenylalanine 4-monooxygenase [Bryobacteraceae bacterium]